MFANASLYRKHHNYIFHTHSEQGDGVQNILHLPGIQLFLIINEAKLNSWNIMHKEKFSPAPQIFSPSKISKKSKILYNLYNNMNCSYKFLQNILFSHYLQDLMLSIPIRSRFFFRCIGLKSALRFLQWGKNFKPNVHRTFKLHQCIDSNVKEILPMSLFRGFTGIPI